MKTCRYCGSVSYCSDICLKTDYINHRPESAICLQRLIDRTFIFDLLSDDEKASAIIFDVATLFAEHNNTEFIGISIVDENVYIVNTKYSSINEAKHWKRDKGFNDKLTVIFSRGNIVHSRTIRVEEHYKLYKDLDKDILNCECIQVCRMNNKLCLVKVNNRIQDVHNIIKIE